MSQRVKKPGRSDDSQGKRRKRRPSGSDPDEDGTRSGSNSGGNGSLSGMWTPRHLNDLKVSSIYNRNSAEAPAELYRKDLISAMKLADSEPLTPEEYWLITDPWKQEWEKGVQVPVNPESLPEPDVMVVAPVAERSHDFRLPKKKYVRVTHDDFFNPDYHELVSTVARAEKVCSYDLDDVDAAWLGCSNSDRSMQNLPVISEFLMEKVIEEFELQCWEQVQSILKNQEGLGIEFDENVICDVCRSPESEEGNEMVFCDACNICVHQACYGITTIPSGSWLCRTCTLGLKPTCELCPNVGGAMKATKSGHKWAHVACAIWIPEVSIGSVEKMEPITKISAIPASRWSLMCVLCKEKSGACIQCSVKTCKTSYHVTCAFKNGLEMKPIIVDENAEDGIKLRSYCEKHSVNTKKDKSAQSGSEEDAEKRKIKAMTAEERNAARAEKLHQIESEFYKYVRLKDVSQNLAVDMDIVALVYNYWKLKRRSLNNRPLVPPRPETTQLLTQQQEQDLEQMKMFVQLRQDLERVRNLCYMVSRREKLSRSFCRLREQTFQKQVAILEEDPDEMPAVEKAAILDANHGPSLYDKLFSHSGVTSTYSDYDTLVNLILGGEVKTTPNGAMKATKSKKVKDVKAPKKTFLNGARRKLGEIGSDSESVSPAKKGEKAEKLVAEKNKISEEAPKKKTAKNTKAASAKGRGLKQMEKSLEKAISSDSDDLDIPVQSSLSKMLTARSLNGKQRENIYSDSDSEAPVGTPKVAQSGTLADGGAASNSAVATKGALKVFTKNKKDKPIKAAVKPKSPRKGKAGAKRQKNSVKATELIVPQRQAAKKATESIRSVKGRKENGDKDGPEIPGTLGTKEASAKDLKSVKLGQDQETLLDEEKESKSRNAAQKRNLDSKMLKESNDIATDPVKEEDVDEEDASKSVFFVPQRKAAKKAAEHIRSGLSNIVAARLIIEDEMEASRKKQKTDKSKKPSENLPLGKSKGRAKSPDKCTAEDAKETGDGTALPAAKGQRTAVKAGAKIPADGTDWPFLDKGSQSACRRSRERSSSSSSSSSSGSSDSSSSSSSSSSSRSSSPEPASPESNIQKKSSIAPSKSAVSAISSSGPGRKLKTSERVTNTGVRPKTPPRAQLTPKGRGSKKPGARRNSITGLNASSPERSPARRASKPDTASPASKQSAKNVAPGGRGSRASRSPKKVSPIKEKSPGRAREPAKRSKEVEDDDFKAEITSVSEKSSAKALRNVTSESDAENRASSPRKNKPMPKTKKIELGLLSESENSAAEEKENSCTSPKDSPRKGSKTSSVPAVSVMSPLTPSGNKDKEQHLASKVSDAEPESKRPRLENASENGASATKSIFSPGAERSELDTLDIDSLTNRDPSNTSTPFFFTQEYPVKTQPKEDSPLATLNLVEKLRLQRARKSGDPSRLSMDEIGGLLEDLKSPGQSEASIVSGKSPASSEKALTQPPLTSPLESARVSGDKSKSIQGDERWVPPGEIPDTKTAAHVYPQVDQNPGLSSTHLQESSRSRRLSEMREKQSFNGIPHDQNMNSEKAAMDNLDKQFLDALKDGNEVSHFGASENAIFSMPSRSLPSATPLISPTLRTSVANVVPVLTSSQLSFHSAAHTSVAGFPQFMYNLNNVNSLNPFFHHGTSEYPSQVTVPKSSPNLPPTSVPSTSSYAASLQSYLQHQKQDFSTNPTSRASDSSSNQLIDVSTKRGLSPSLVSAVTSAMPPLAKPPLSSPSVLLAPSKTVTQPPPQSNAAQLIETFVNSHSSSLKGKQLNSNTMNVPTSNSFSFPQQLKQDNLNGEVKPKLEESIPVHLNKTENTLSAPMPAPTKGAGRGKRGAGRGKGIKEEQEQEVSPKSARGRGGKGASVAATSPARANARQPAGSRKGSGRGRGKGKNILVRKDLLGTVYDIDFDEFDDNPDEKFDLRSMRERRKSNEVYGHPVEPKKVESLHISPARMEKASPRYRNAHDGDHGRNKAEKAHNAVNNVVPVPSPVDMRTYSGIPEQSTGPVPSGVHSKHPAADTQPRVSSSSAPLSNNVINNLDTSMDSFSSAQNESNHATGPLYPGPTSKEANFGLPASSSFANASDASMSSVNRDSPFSNSLGANVDTINHLKMKIKAYVNYSSQQTPVEPGLQPSYNNSHMDNSHMLSSANVPSSMSNRARMRKKELLRQYWTQDMNMDGTAPNQMPYSSDMVGAPPPAIAPHPFNRSVITIPKAVASMTIIPTKDDYRMDNLSDNEGSNPGTSLLSALDPPQKKKRSRGVNREMAALGLLPPGAAKERRRDRASVGDNINEPADSANKKRVRGGNGVSRSTFIPPTLVDLADEPTPTNVIAPAAAKGKTGQKANNANTVSHPGPKLKIKFGSGLNAIKSSNLSDSETPAKKAKGRPPKKRGLPAAATAPAPPTMEELKRQMMMHREQVMQEFDVHEQQNPSAASKKHKNKKGKKGSTSNAVKNSKVQVVTTEIATSGPKLILRFKNRPTANEAKETDAAKIVSKTETSKTQSLIAADPKVDMTKNNALLDKLDTVGKGNTQVPLPHLSNDSGNSTSTITSCSSQNLLSAIEPECGENIDSGFTGSSEGSSNGSAEAIVSKPLACKRKETNTNQESKGKANCNHNSTAALQQQDVVPGDLQPDAAGGSESLEKVMPIRLKLSRCFEGYEGWKKKDSEREKANPKQSDSCEVR